MPTEIFAFFCGGMLGVFVTRAFIRFPSPGEMTQRLVERRAAAITEARAKEIVAAEIERAATAIVHL